MKNHIGRLNDHFSPSLLSGLWVPCQLENRGNSQLCTCAWIVIPPLLSMGSYTGHRIWSYCPLEPDSSCWPKSEPFAAIGVSQPQCLVACGWFFRFPRHTRPSLPCAASQRLVSLIHLPSCDEDKVFLHGSCSATSLAVCWQGHCNSFKIHLKKLETVNHVPSLPDTLLITW